jgi:hypothetical protein
MIEERQAEAEKLTPLQAYLSGLLKGGFRPIGNQ